MARCLRDRKTVRQNTVNRLLAYYELALYYSYPVEKAKRVAVLSVETEMQGGSWESSAQAMRIAQHTTHGGKETAETFDRLVDGRQATMNLNLWYIDDVHVDEQIVKAPETQTVEQIDADNNAERKRIRIERFGWPRYLRESKAMVIDTRDNYIDSTKESLMEVNFRTFTQTWNEVTQSVHTEVHEKATVLVCACPSTARVYAMRVPREIVTCEMAQRWLHGDQVTRPLRIIGAS